jgi:hypothetical protein
MCDTARETRMSDSPESQSSIPIPAIVVVLAVFFGAMKFEGFRPIGARAVAIWLPIGVVWAGVGKLRDAHPLLRKAGQALGALILLLAGLCTVRVFFGVSPLAVDPALLRAALGSLAVASLLIEAIAARRSLRVRISAWLGIALGFAAYLAAAAPPEPGSELGLAFVAAVIGLWGGGLAGLLLGALAARLAVTPKAP